MHVGEILLQISSLFLNDAGLLPYGWYVSSSSDHTFAIMSMKKKEKPGVESGISNTVGMNDVLEAKMLKKHLYDSESTDPRHVIGNTYLPIL